MSAGTDAPLAMAVPAGTAAAAAPSIFLVAGEPSGDVLGGRLMAALRGRAPGVRFVGCVGGPRMAEQGLDSLFPMDDLTLMGFAEVVPSVPRVLRRLRETAEAIERARPDLVLTIDSPGFSLRLHRHLAARPIGRSLRRVHYVAPQVWAWWPGRAKRLAGVLDHLLVLLPFEPPFFEAHGLPCTFVGHPVVEEPAACSGADPCAFRARHGLPPDAPLVCTLPGSRRSEIDQHMPVLGATLPLLAARLPGLRAVLPTLPAIAPRVRAAAAGWPVPVTVVEDRAERFGTYAASSVAIAASGTVALEIALAGLPLVTIYRTTPLTAFLARRLIRVRYVNLINLVLDRPAVPELLQDDCRPDRIAAEAMRLIQDGALCDRQKAAMAEATALLGRGGEPPSRRAAEALLRVMAAGPPQQRRRTS
jgi:lipid-A-disaccharide synthase